MILYTLEVTFSIYLLTPGKRNMEDYSWGGGEICASFAAAVHPNTHSMPCGPSSLPQALFHPVQPIPYPTSISYSPATPVPFFTHLPRLQPSCSCLFSLFSKAQAWRPTNQKQWATTDLGLCPDRASSILSVTTPREGGCLASLGGLATVS